MTDTTFSTKPAATDAAVPAPASGEKRKVIVPLRRRRWFILLCQIALGVGALLVWEFGARDQHASWKLIDEYYVSKPSQIWNQLWKWQDQGILIESILVTLRETVYGFAVGAGSGMIMGFLLGVNRFLASLLTPFLNAIYSIPRLALVPLFMLWFGIGEASKIYLIASVVFFLVFYATLTGVRDVDHEIGERLRLMRASTFTVHMKATLPSAMTFIIAGLRVSGPYALVVAVTSEMLMSNRGLGFLVQRSSNQFVTAGVFAALFVMMIVGIALMAFITAIEKRLLKWKPRRADDRA